MRKDKNPALAAHFQRLKEVLPEVYQQQLFPENNSLNDRLVSLLKQSLIVIEAMYLQNPDSFSSARVEAYTSIVSQLNTLGVHYLGNAELIGKSTHAHVMQTKLPMERAGRRGTSSDQNQERQAM